MKPREIVEIIMTQHWDLAACRCWVCKEGRAHGCRPREQYLHHPLRAHGPERRYVSVEQDASFEVVVTLLDDLEAFAASTRVGLWGRLRRPFRNWWTYQRYGKP